MPNQCLTSMFRCIEGLETHKEGGRVLFQQHRPSFFVYHCTFLFSLADGQCHAPCTSPSKLCVETERIADAALGEGGAEVVVQEDGERLDCHLVVSALAQHLFVLHLAQQDADTQVEGIVKRVEVWVEAGEALGVAARQGLQDGGIEVADGYGERADELLVAGGEARARDAVGVHLDAVEGLVCIPKDVGLVKQNTQSQLPVVPDAALDIPRADIFQKLCTEEHAWRVEHTCQYLHTGVARRYEGAHGTLAVDGHPCRHGNHVIALSAETLHGGDEVVVELIIAVEEIHPFGLARPQSFVARSCRAGEGLSEQGDVGAILDILLAELIGSIGTLIVNDDDFFGRNT